MEFGKHRDGYRIPEVPGFGNRLGSSFCKNQGARVRNPQASELDNPLGPYDCPRDPIGHFEIDSLLIRDRESIPDLVATFGEAAEILTELSHSVLQAWTRL